MEKRSTMAVMVVRAGPFHSSIKALMSTITQIQIVAEAKELSALLHMDPEVRPDLMVMEADFSDDEFSDVMQQIMSQWARTRLIVLVENEEERRMAEASGADAVLTKGFRAVRFVEVVDKLLSIEPLIGERS